jgi:hypothetical protein
LHGRSSIGEFASIVSVQIEHSSACNKSHIFLFLRGGRGARIVLIMEVYIACSVMIIASLIQNIPVVCALIILLTTLLTIWNLYKGQRHDKQWILCVWLTWYLYTCYSDAIVSDKLLFDIPLADIPLGLLGMWCAFGIERNKYGLIRNPVIIILVVLCLLPVREPKPYAIIVTNTTMFALACSALSFLIESTKKPNNQNQSIILSASCSWILFVRFNGISMLLGVVYLFYLGFMIGKRLNNKVKPVHNNTTTTTSSNNHVVTTTPSLSNHTPHYWTAYNKKKLKTIYADVDPLAQEIRKMNVQKQVDYNIKDTNIRTITIDD